MTESTRAYGIVAEFEDPTTFVEAAKQIKEAGYRYFEAYSPYPIKDLFEIVPGGNSVPAMVLLGGVTGGVTAWLMQYYIAAIEYPINVGGRPLHSWPAFVPILFELTVLLASLAAFFGTLYLCGFPKLHFPLFDLEEFAKASSNRFFLCVESRDPSYSLTNTANLLNKYQPIGVWEVEAD